MPSLVFCLQVAAQERQESCLAQGSTRSHAMQKTLTKQQNLKSLKPSTKLLQMLQILQTLQVLQLLQKPNRVVKVFLPGFKETLGS